MLLPGNELRKKPLDDALRYHILSCIEAGDDTCRRERYRAFLGHGLPRQSFTRYTPHDHISRVLRGAAERHAIILCSPLARAGTAPVESADAYLGRVG